MTRKIGQYEIVRELGQGGMGTVYLGRDPRLDREVAIKVLKPQLYMEDPEFSARFEREAKTVASLTHNCIVPIYEYGDDGQWRYFVMPNMVGGSLRDRLEGKAMPLGDVLPIMYRVTAGLDKAHRSGIVHRDLKPGNILFDADGEAYLSDFGIVKLADPTGKGTVQMTSTGVALGTPHYMSPEQLDGVADLDARSDIYALGIILYEMLSGKKPFDHESMPRIIAMHYNQPIPNILESNPNLPPGMAEVIRTAMAKKREERYGSVREMYAGIQQAVSRPAASQTPARPKPEPRPTPEKQPQVPAKRAPAPRPTTAEPNQVKPARQPVYQADQSVGTAVSEQPPHYSQGTPPQVERDNLTDQSARHSRFRPGLFLLFSGVPIVVIVIFFFSRSFLTPDNFVYELESSLYGNSEIFRDLTFNLRINPYPGYLFPFLVLPIAILIGFLQWLYLRKHLIRAWLWMPLYSGLTFITSLITYLFYSRYFIDIYFSSGISASPTIFMQVLIGASMFLLPAIIGFVWLLAFPGKAGGG